MSLEEISQIAQCVTALSVVLAVFQLFLAKRQAITRFEDQLQQRYFEIVASLPVKVFLAQRLTDEELEVNLRAFYTYFQLANNQISLRTRGKVTRKTWRNWADGMRFNFALPAFTQAWETVTEELDTEEGRMHLQGLLRSHRRHFLADPKT